MDRWFPKKIVLVPVDSSDAAFEAVRVARELVAEESGLHILHVLIEQPVVAMEGMASLPVTDEEIERARQAVKRRLERIGVREAVVTIRVGSPVPDICDYAKEIDAGLIVIPSHGRTGVKHLLIGSVAERVARHAGCPVLILRREP